MVELRIETLKDLKGLLNNIPDEVLQNLVVGESEDGIIGLETTEGEDEFEGSEAIKRDMDKYEELVVIDNYIQNIASELKDNKFECETITNKDPRTNNDI